jgi:hypothetical protein
MKIKNDKEYNELFNKNFTGIIEFTDGARELHSIHYYKNGKHHRKDGPARIWSLGLKAYYFYGKQYNTEEEWKTKVEKSRK